MTQEKVPEVAQPCPAAGIRLNKGELHENRPLQMETPKASHILSRFSGLHEAKSQDEGTIPLRSKSLLCLRKWTGRASPACAASSNP